LLGGKREEATVVEVDGKEEKSRKFDSKRYWWMQQLHATELKHLQQIIVKNVARLNARETFLVVSSIKLLRTRKEEKSRMSVSALHDSNLQAVRSFLMRHFQSTQKSKTRLN